MGVQLLLRQQQMEPATVQEGPQPTVPSGTTRGWAHAVAMGHALSADRDVMSRFIGELYLVHQLLEPGDMAELAAGAPGSLHSLSISAPMLVRGRGGGRGGGGGDIPGASPLLRTPQFPVYRACNACLAARADPLFFSQPSPAGGREGRSFRCHDRASAARGCLA